MIQIHIQSRMIKSVYFNPKDGGLRLILANGEDRYFREVPLDAVVNLVNASSPGNHYVDMFRHHQMRAA